MTVFTAVVIFVAAWVAAMGILHMLEPHINPSHS